ncbi:MAG: NDP-sugar synthase [Nitrospiraceae bacterium]
MIHSANRASDTHRDADFPEIIALIPAAGQGTRISPLPCSKEIFPLGLAHHEDADGIRPKVVCQYLLEKMRKAGAQKGIIILRQGKWDIPGYCGDGAFVDMKLAYLMMGAPYGPPYSIDQAFSFVHHARIVFGFPDILFEPDDVFIRLLDKQRVSHADVVLGLFPAHNSRHMDMVQVDSSGKVVGIHLKPLQTDLRWAWVCAVWSAVFTKFLHRRLGDISILRETDSQGIVQARSDESYELSIGHLLQAALAHGLDIQTVTFPKGIYFDIGTPEGLDNALRAVLIKRFTVSSKK